MDLVTLEGLHALKHAARFGATITDIVTDDVERVLAAADQLAPELRPLLAERVRVVPTATFRERAAQPIPTRVLAHAEPATWTLAQALPTPGRPAVLLDDPRNSKNLGAVVRVGAAAGASGILVAGPADVWDPMAVRGAAGLQWALPCLGSTSLLSELDVARASSPYVLVGLDAGGIPYDPGAFPGPTVFAFGSERTGLSDAVRARCDTIVSLPMRPHVSSLNLATSVSAVLYLRLYSARRDPLI